MRGQRGHVYVKKMMAGARGEQTQTENTSTHHRTRQGEREHSGTQTRRRREKRGKGWGKREEEKSGCMPLLHVVPTTSVVSPRADHVWLVALCLMRLAVWCPSTTRRKEKGKLLRPVPTNTSPDSTTHDSHNRSGAQQDRAAAAQEEEEGEQKCEVWVRERKKTRQEHNKKTGHNTHRPITRSTIQDNKQKKSQRHWGGWHTCWRVGH
jgi:hypothetical protein